MAHPFPEPFQMFMHDSELFPDFNDITDMTDQDENSESIDVFVFLVNEEKSAISSIGDTSLICDIGKSYPSDRHKMGHAMNGSYGESSSLFPPSPPSTPTSPICVRSMCKELDPFFLSEPEEKEDYDTTALFSLISNKKWLAVLQYLTQHKEEASVWVDQENTGPSRVPPRLPLHEACTLQAPKDVISALIDAYPTGAQFSEISGALPLHLACQNKAPLGSIRALLRAYPRAATVAVGGLLPIHIACMGHDVSLAIVEALLRTHPEGRSARDKNGYTPLTYYELSSCPRKEWGLKMILLHEPTKSRQKRLHSCSF
uniref:Uncharacterized protein n=1 Tax=Ditylum brightwellii TaxID=49249 RepID=A0A7S4WAI9_9STRA|mmetsp:Transcript_34140/g.45647  ORF Transcript_34140/g.45647 Transcript_34140/m.45647 type:complete len:315 (+) Transcript_34140:87-1031(+)